MGDDGLFAKYAEGWHDEFGLHHWRPGELGGSVHDTNDTGDGGGDAAPSVVDGNISMMPKFCASTTVSSTSSSSDMIMGDDGLFAKYAEG